MTGLELRQIIREEVITLHDKMDKLKDSHAEDKLEIMVEITKLKLKSGIWGAAGATIPILAAITIALATGLASN
jgi:hypothetical protein